MSCNPRERSRRESSEEDGAEVEDSLRVPVICNNLERALFLSLRYQFVTPLTSLVVVKPDSMEQGDIAEADLFNKKIQLYSGASAQTPLMLVLPFMIFLMFC